jgi:hypothetical protein
MSIRALVFPTAMERVNSLAGFGAALETLVKVRLRLKQNTLIPLTRNLPQLTSKVVLAAVCLVVRSDAVNKAAEKVGKYTKTNFR